MKHKILILGLLLLISGCRQISNMIGKLEHPQHDSYLSECDFKKDIKIIKEENSDEILSNAELGLAYYFSNNRLESNRYFSKAINAYEAKERTHNLYQYYIRNKYQGEDYDLAGFCVGIVDKDKIIDGSKVANGDHIIALASSGPHSNGYSLIRKVLEQSKPTEAQLNALIEPTRIYVKSVLSLIEKFPVHAISHITGGGLLENIPRVLPANLAAKLDANSWELPEIFQFLQDNGNIDIMEMYRVFNCGVGMVIVIPAEQSEQAIAYLNELGETAWLIGDITQNDGNQVII